MDPVKHYFLGLAYLKNAQKVEARAALQQALDLDPKFAYAQQAKEALATLGDGGQ
jgi:Flp pilus assembly protein TadD